MDGLNRKVLLIVASGKSSRFGGFPKAFCKIGNRTNVDNTIFLAKQVFDKIYVAVSKTVFEQYSQKIENGELFSIITGQGDAHSILKCLNYIKYREENLRQIVICWGDAVFTDSTPFKELLAGVTGERIAVACAMDERPYAWFETNEKHEIIKSHFAKEEGGIKSGLHDQSLFLLDFDFAIQYLNEYRKELKIPYDNDEQTINQNEMKLLHSFEYLHKHGYDHARCIEITSGKVHSFNTQEELADILSIITSQ